MSLENTNWSKLFGNPCKATDFFIENCGKTCFGCPLPSDVCDFTYSEGTQRERISAWLMSCDEEGYGANIGHLEVGE